MLGKLSPKGMVGRVAPRGTPLANAHAATSLSFLTVINSPAALFHSSSSQRSRRTRRLRQAVGCE